MMFKFRFSTRTLHPRLLVWILLLTACQPVAVSQPSALPTQDGRPVTLVMASHSSFNASQARITEFEQAHNVTLQFLDLGDAGEALNKVILSKDAPLADLFFGVDNTFLSRALDADIFEPYPSPLLAQVDDGLKLDPAFRVLPVDYGYVNLNADGHWFQEQGLPLPTTLEELTQPAYRGLLVVQNPATSSPGLAFLLATIGHFGPEGYLSFWEALRDNDVVVTDGWSEAYFEYFTVGSGGSGDRPLVVSYSTSPPADVVYATDGRTEPASVNLNLDGGVFRQIEFVGILKGTQQPELARALVDFLLSRPFQEDIPLQMFVYPANSQAQLPQLFIAYAAVPENAVEVAPADIEAQRESWIRAWSDLMLRP